MNDEQPWWDSRVGKRMLKEGATYESDNCDSGALSPFDKFVFLALNVDNPSETAVILVLYSEDLILYPIGSVHTISPAYWIWTSATRLT